MPQPPIVIVGGHMSWPKDYRRLASVLRNVSGSAVHIARLTPLDWALGHLRGYGQMVFEIATTVDRALLESESERAVIVGHSAGGLLSRIYLGGEEPYGGRRFSGYRRVSNLITLGTPHEVSAKGRLSDLVSELNSMFTGALHSERVSYLSVAGDAVDGADSRRAHGNYAKLAADGAVTGDGVVPVELTRLPGASHLVLDGVWHARKHGRWYGQDAQTVRSWLPPELVHRGGA